MQIASGAPPIVIPAKNDRTKPAAGAVVLSSGPQLFIDDYLIAESAHVAKVIQQPRRFRDASILGPAQRVTQPYVSVAYDESRRHFRLWYNYASGRDGAVAYAESSDGVRFETPNLGILGADNRVLRISSDFQASYGSTVVDNGPLAKDPQRRFLLAWWGQQKQHPEADPGMRIAFSPDGLRWTPYDGNPVLPDFSEKEFLDDPRRPYGVGDIVDLYYDPVRKRYGGFVKTPAVPLDGLPSAPRASTYIRRLVSATFSPDMIRWQRPWRVIVPESRDEGLLEFYGAGGTIARGPLLIAFVRMLHDDYSPNVGGEATGIGYTALVTSRDGEHWERHADVFFDRDPDANQWDHAMAWISAAVPVGDELYLYYGGYRRGHKIEPLRERQIGVVKMPLDRFVARQAGTDSPGRLVTVPLDLSKVLHARLLLNADARGGSIRVALRDGDGAALAGYGLDDARAVTADGQNLAAGWEKSLDQLPTPRVRLEFELRAAKLYGFSFAGP